LAVHLPHALAVTSHITSIHLRSSRLGVELVRIVDDGDAAIVRALQVLRDTIPASRPHTKLAGLLHWELVWLSGLNRWWGNSIGQSA
jgi:hypothetical protein